MLGLQQAGVDLIRKNVLSPTFGNLRIEEFEVRHAASQYNHFRVQDIDYGGEGSSEAVHVVVKDSVSHGFPLGCRLDNFSRARVVTAGILVGSSKDVARNPGLDAA